MLYITLFIIVSDHNIKTKSIAFNKSTSQRIYPKQHTRKIGQKLHKHRLKICFTYVGWSF